MIWRLFVTSNEEPPTYFAHLISKFTILIAVLVTRFYIYLSYSYSFFKK